MGVDSRNQRHALLPPSTIAFLADRIRPDANGRWTLGWTGCGESHDMKIAVLSVEANQFPGGGRQFRAHDKATGEILHEIELPAKQTGLPMTYAIDGIQYIVVPVGDTGHPGELVALRLKQE